MLTSAFLYAYWKGTVKNWGGSEGSRIEMSNIELPSHCDSFLSLHSSSLLTFFNSINYSYFIVYDYLLCSFERGNSNYLKVLLYYFLNKRNCKHTKIKEHNQINKYLLSNFNLSTHFNIKMQTVWICWFCIWSKQAKTKRHDINLPASKITTMFLT